MSPTHPPVELPPLPDSALRKAGAAVNEIFAEYQEAYATGQAHAASLIWQSIQKGPGGTPEWDLDEVQRPGGGFFWKSGAKREHCDWMVTFGPGPSIAPYEQDKLKQDWDE